MENKFEKIIVDINRLNSLDTQPTWEELRKLCNDEKK